MEGIWSVLIVNTRSSSTNTLLLTFPKLNVHNEWRVFQEWVKEKPWKQYKIRCIWYDICCYSEPCVLIAYSILKSESANASFYRALPKLPSQILFSTYLLLTLLYMREVKIPLTSNHWPSCHSHLAPYAWRFNDSDDDNAIFSWQPASSFIRRLL